MINIFNIYLFLFFLWSIFMLIGHNFSFYFLIFGAFAAILVAIISKYLKLFDKKSELLFLSIGFYRHFGFIYFKNYFKSLKIIFDLATHRRSLHPTLHKIPFQENYKFNPELLIASINFAPGLLAINYENNEITIHTIHEDYFYEFNLLKNIISLNNINDDNLV